MLIVGGLFSSGLLSTKKNPSQAEIFPKESLVSKSFIKVDISGAVLKPGVISLEPGSRVEDVINLAGGFSKEANNEYISKSLNLSQKISDGQKIYIPFQGENFTSPQVAGVSTNGKIGLNSGTGSELESLPGIGPVTAGKIINARPYSDISELLSKKVVSKSVYEKIKDSVEIR